MEGRRTRERPWKQPIARRGVWGSALKLRAVWEGARREAKVRTGLGKSHRPGSQGGIRKRGLWRRLNGHGKRKRRNSQAFAYGCTRCISIPTFVTERRWQPVHVATK